ncbi:pilus assembly protein, partial [Sutterella massiliensis]|nr:pilus assembly protein [Sutterella massiliensis]
SDDWVKRQIAAGRTGNLGEQGAMREILERDLIEAAKERVLQIDWDEKKARAAKRAWANLQYECLPSASIDAVRYIDPTILVEKDILDLNGNAVRKAGERVNP